MDAHISRKMENGWRFQSLISRKPCIRIGWNCLGKLLSPICISPWNRFWNGWMDMEKMQKWLMVMEADSLETVHRNCMKLLRHVFIDLVQSHIKRFVKWMHGSQVMAKTNSALWIFASRHFACVCIVWQNEFWLWCRYGDDGGGVERVQDASKQLRKLPCLPNHFFWNPWLVSLNFYRKFL